jgi:signal transduction histidine kinase
MLAYAGKGRVVVAELAVNDLVRQAIDSLGVGAVSSSLSADKVVIHGDAEQLRQLVANLVVNAIEAAPGGKVHIATSRTRLDATAAAQLRRTPGLSAGEYAVIEVRDDGHGMDDATLERAFEPFFSTRFPGRGLGLAVVLGVTRVHRGGLDVETGSGRGTAVRVFLPLVG